MSFGVEIIADRRIVVHTCSNSDPDIFRGILITLIITSIMAMNAKFTRDANEVPLILEKMHACSEKDA